MKRGERHEKSWLFLHFTHVINHDTVGRTEKKELRRKVVWNDK
ncbi:hypothetical protein III_01854 [Bacillus mycoides]|uniref:Uncharacterized protein n=1 Tax=Bacillus mycoides TaxID=1405 RepID=A0ABC9R7W9_BACMY|nr:hypothetical protein III_01854 [Bacillus mycoides]